MTLTDDQTIAAADSLAQEISNLCGNQPMEVVMTAFAALIALGIGSMRDPTTDEDEAIELHIKLVRFFIKRQRERRQ